MHSNAKKVGFHWPFAAGCTSARDFHYHRPFLASSADRLPLWDTINERSPFLHTSSLNTLRRALEERDFPLSFALFKEIVIARQSIAQTATKHRISYPIYKALTRLCLDHGRKTQSTTLVCDVEFLLLQLSQAHTLQLTEVNSLLTAHLHNLIFRKDSWARMIEIWESLSTHKQAIMSHQVPLVIKQKVYPSSVSYRLMIDGALESHDSARLLSLLKSLFETSLDLDKKFCEWMGLKLPKFDSESRYVALEILVGACIHRQDFTALRIGSFAPSPEESLRMLDQVRQSGLKSPKFDAFVSATSLKIHRSLKSRLLNSLKRTDKALRDIETAQIWKLMVKVDCWRNDELVVTSLHKLVVKDGQMKDIVDKDVIVAAFEAVIHGKSESVWMEIKGGNFSAYRRYRAEIGSAKLFQELGLAHILEILYFSKTFQNSIAEEIVGDLCFHVKRNPESSEQIYEVFLHILNAKVISSQEQMALSVLLLAYTPLPTNSITATKIHHAILRHVSRTHVQAAIKLALEAADQGDSMIKNIVLSFLTLDNGRWMLILGELYPDADYTSHTLNNLLSNASLDISEFQGVLEFFLNKHEIIPNSRTLDTVLSRVINHSATHFQDQITRVRYWMEIFEQHGVRATPSTFALVLKPYAAVGNVDGMKEIVSRMEANHVSWNPWTLLVYCRGFIKAEKEIDLEKVDLVVGAILDSEEQVGWKWLCYEMAYLIGPRWLQIQEKKLPHIEISELRLKTKFILFHASRGDVEEVWRLLDELLVEAKSSPDTQMWDAVLNCEAKRLEADYMTGDVDKSGVLIRIERLRELMERSGAELSKWKYANLLRIYGLAGEQELEAELWRAVPPSMVDEALYSVHLRNLSRSGAKETSDFFATIPCPTMYDYSTMISCLAECGDWSSIELLYAKAQQLGIDGVELDVGRMKCLGYLGMMDQVLEIWNTMWRQGKVDEVAICVVLDAAGQGGWVDVGRGIFRECVTTFNLGAFTGRDGKRYLVRLNSNHYLSFMEMLIRGLDNSQVSDIKAELQSVLKDMQAAGITGSRKMVRNVRWMLKQRGRASVARWFLEVAEEEWGIRVEESH